MENHMVLKDNVTNVTNKMMLKIIDIYIFVIYQFGKQGR